MIPSREQIVERVATAFGVPPAMLGVGPEPAYRSPYRSLIPVGNYPGADDDRRLYSLLAQADESREAELERFRERLRRWFAR